MNKIPRFIINRRVPNKDEKSKNLNRLMNYYKSIGKKDYFKSTNNTVLCVFILTTIDCFVHN